MLSQKPNTECLGSLYACCCSWLWLFCQPGWNCARFEKPVFPAVSLVVLSKVHPSLLSEGGRCAAQQEGASNSPQRSDTAAVSPAWPQAEEEGAFQEFKFSRASSIKQHKQRGTVLANEAFWCFAVYDAVVMLKQRTDRLCLTTHLCYSKAFGFH